MDLDQERYPSLNLPPCTLTLRVEEGSMMVLDTIRHRYVALTPEEWVRQHIIHLLHRVMGYPQELLQVEGSIVVNGLPRRCDMVVYRPEKEGNTTSLKPVMIVECKQPAVALCQRVVDQACRYNDTLHVPFLFLTNGLQHLCLRVNAAEQRLEQMLNFPTWQELLDGGNIEVLPEEHHCNHCAHGAMEM